MLSSPPPSARLYLVAQSTSLCDTVGLAGSVRFIALPTKSSGSGDAAPSLVTLGRQSPCLRWALGGSRSCSRQLLRFEIYTSLARNDDAHGAKVPPCQSVHPQLPNCAVCLQMRDKNKFVHVVRYASERYTASSPCVTPAHDAPSIAAHVGENGVWLRVGDRVVIQGGVVTLCLIAVQLRRAVSSAACEGAESRGGCSTAGSTSFSVSLCEWACAAMHSALALPVITWPSAATDTPHMTTSLRHMALCEAWRVFREQLVRPPVTVARATSPPAASTPSRLVARSCQALLANSQAAVLAVPSTQCMRAESSDGRHGNLSDSMENGAVGVTGAVRRRSADVLCTSGGGIGGHGGDDAISDATLDASDGELEEEDGPHGEEEEEAATPSHSQRVRPRAAVALDRHAPLAAASTALLPGQHDEATTAAQTDSIASARRARLVGSNGCGITHNTHYVETYDEKLDSALCDLESRSNAIGYQLLERGSSASVLGGSEDDGLPMPPPVAGQLGREDNVDSVAVYSPSADHHPASSGAAPRGVPSCTPHDDRLPVTTSRGVRRNSQGSSSRRCVDAVFMNTTIGADNVAGYDWKRGRAGTDGLTATATMQRRRLNAPNVPRQSDESQEVFFRH